MVLDGKALAQEILTDLSLRVHELQKTKQSIPHMAVIQVGNDPATNSYVSQKEKMAKEIGATLSTYKCDPNVSEKEIEEMIDFLQQKGDINGIILQIPLPQHLNTNKLLELIQPQKDIDGFRHNSPFIVPVASAVLKLLEESYVITETTKLNNFYAWLASKKIVVIGKGKTGGEPIIRLLIKLGLSPIVIDTKTENPENLTKQADIIICAVGREGIVNKSMLKKDVILIGVGMSKGEDGKFYGDYNPSEIKDIASVYTPIPGGVGPVNVAMLMQNLVIAAENSKT